MNSVWRRHDSPLAFLVQLRSGPRFTARVHPALVLVLDTYLEISAGHGPAHTLGLVPPKVCGCWHSQGQGGPAAAAGRQGLKGGAILSLDPLSAE